LVNAAGSPVEPPAPGTPSTDPNNPFNPWTPDALAQGTSWKELGQDGSILLGKLSLNGGHIGVRIAPTSSAGPLAATLRTTVVFGREPRAYQPYASPFTLNWGTSNLVCTVFSTVAYATGSRTDFPPPNSGSAWFTDLGPIANAPLESSGPLSQHYDFTVGASVNGGAVTYGHDPEMDVTC